jgi:hypothetical protein
MAIIGDILSKFLVIYPFASAKVMSRHFGMSSSTAKEVLSHELRFRKCARRWVSHLLDEAQKNHRRALAIKFFNCCGDGKPMILMALQLVMSQSFTMITNRARWLQRREKK